MATPRVTVKPPPKLPKPADSVLRLRSDGRYDGWIDRSTETWPPELQAIIDAYPFTFDGLLTAARLELREAGLTGPVAVTYATARAVEAAADAAAAAATGDARAAIVAQLDALAWGEVVREYAAELTAPTEEAECPS